MRYFLAPFAVLAALAGLLPAQTPEFDAASVKPSAGGARRAMVASPGRIMFTAVTLRDCLMAAYDVKDYQITGPDWLRTDRFDIVATVPEPASPDAAPAASAGQTPPAPNNGQAAPVLTAAMRQMLQKLLNDRFQITLHHEQRDLPVYAMVVGKNGTKLKEAETPGRSSVQMNGGTVTLRNVTVQELLDYMSRLRTAEMDRPVVDNTGLKGQYNVTVNLFGTQEEMMAALNKGDFGTSIFTLLQEQLGLKLEPEKLPLDMIVIDKAVRTPVEN